MNDQAFESLEYAALRELVRREAQTPMGAMRAAGLAPMNDAEMIRRALRLVSESITLRERGAMWTFSELGDPTEAIQRLAIEGAPLDGLSLLELARVCEGAASARSIISNERERAPVLWELVSQLPAATERLAARVTAKILPSGDVDDRASAELARVRSEISRLRSTITRSLETLMRRQEEAVQDQIVTVRNDRFVIPVRAEARSRIGGVAHGVSSSGATVFVEPLESIEANNELQLLRDREAREVAQVLARLSDELRLELPVIKLASDIIAELDFTRAKSRLATRLDCIEPVIESDEKRATIELEEARHPLLDERLRREGKSAVPCSFTLSNERPVMVISGANAGGKTVVLKTAGLIALAALSGLHVPAKRARVPVYRSILADIGDAQSLAANLSTFTAHVSNIRRMIDVCESPALVLLDEVGTGTDPEEGSALGVAVVDHFRRECGAHLIATTHYRGLKIYAANDESVTNASVEFDERTLQPTYRLLLGLAGSSSGLEIARRFGFPETIIEAAIGRVEVSSREASAYLNRIKRESEEAKTLRHALEEERAAVAEKYAALDRDAERRATEQQREFEREMQKLLRDFEQQATKATADIAAKIEDRAARARAERDAATRRAEVAREAERLKREHAKSARASSSGARVVRQDTGTTSTASASTNGETFIASRTRDAGDIKAGDRVRVLSLDTIGIVERRKGDEVEVRAGVLRFREKLDNLELVEAVPEPSSTRGARLQRQAHARGTELRLRETSFDASSELNLIGRTVDEATDATDKFLDEAYMHNLNPIRIVHGIGTGALKRAIADLLRHHPHVARYSTAPREQGGDGATIVELKS
ncbi:MAG: Smr/MutS family protein [Pyrinomonadaceae bacterium MAG19_C2-C3]|nr:Smr/MutS family protein [Pyrinomonadaceae bacterium MAG19_C2-C3]